MTRLCVAIFVNSAVQADDDALAAVRGGAEMIELRIDRIGTEFRLVDFNAGVIQLVTHVPCVVTCRPTWEGGEYALAEDLRLSVLNLVSKEVDYADIELAADEEKVAEVIHSRHSNRKRCIASSHDFAGRPERLYSIVAELNASPADIAKIVWTARSIRDNLEAFEILQNQQKPTVALCMGEAGLISRVLAKKFNAFLTFASLDADSGTAPGQVSITDMKRLYRWDAISPATKVYGVVGSPIGHSMSPAIHNAAFEHVGHDGVYLPLLVEPSYESFKAFMESFLHFDGLHLSGLSITIPHKENALRYLKAKGGEVEALAERIGAVNTIVIEGRTLRGLNTDYAAILDSITTALNITREQLADYRVAVIGAGGTGRTAVAALAHCGATVVVYNRTPDRAAALAAEFDGKTGKVVAAKMEKLCDSCCQIYLNTTSIGMHPNVAESAFGEKSPALGSNSLVFDAVYNPMRTKLIEQAEAAGAKTVGGVEMFVRQAAAQFTAWTGKPAPMDVMREVIEKRLVRK